MMTSTEIRALATRFYERWCKGGYAAPEEQHDMAILQLCLEEFASERALQEQPSVDEVSGAVVSGKQP